MQPSEYEIQREVEALRDIRRRSSGPGALLLDPDLPNAPSQASPSQGYWTSAASPPSLTDGESASSHEGSSISDHNAHHLQHDSHRRQSDEVDEDVRLTEQLHLYWVPASMHPEIAPAEFRAFLKEHARTLPADGSQGAAAAGTSLSRAGSGASLQSSASLGRKKSMLSRQYKPREGDDDDDDKVVPIKRTKSTLYRSNGPQLGIDDLLKLEALAEEAQTNDDPTKLRTMLRRSLSLNLSPSALERMENMPDLGDEADAPIIVPPPGQILRRAARTKIRKPGLPGEGAHRFSGRRGNRSQTQPLPSAAGTSADDGSSEGMRRNSDASSTDHESSESVSQGRARSFSNERLDDEKQGYRPESFSVETSIFDAYWREEAEDDQSQQQLQLQPAAIVVSPPLTQRFEEPVIPSPLPAETLPKPLVQSPPPEVQEPPVAEPEIQEQQVEEQPILQHPQPQRPVPLSSTTTSPSVTRTPSPESAPSPQPSPSQDPHAVQQQQQAQPHRKEKNKGGLFSKWGTDKSSKKSSSSKEEKESGFFGSLFGGAKKKQEDASSGQTLGHSANGRAAAQALLGASKSKSASPSPSPANGGPAGAGGAMMQNGVLVDSWSRYPISVERAIYRLSHIKLANPRRPLYEQVLISNLMFWYLGVINKAQQQQQQQQQQAAAIQQQQQQQQKQSVSAAESAVPAEADPHEAEKTASSAHDAPEHGQQYQQNHRAEEEQTHQQQHRQQQHQPRKSMDQHQHHQQQKKDGGSSSTRRGPLTKPPPANIGSNSRRVAEMPVRAPQYDAQHRAMEQEYSGYGGGGGSPSSSSSPSPPPVRTGSAPPLPMNPHLGSGPKIHQSQSSQSGNNNYYYGGAYEANGQQQQLPAGAMQPANSLPPGAMPPATTGVDQNGWTNSANGGAPQGTTRSQRTMSSPASPSPSLSSSTSGGAASQPGYPRPSRSPPPAQKGYGAGGRPPARSLSATAVGGQQQPVVPNGRLRKGTSAHAAMPSGGGGGGSSRPRSASKSTEEEDVPLAVWQQQRRR